MLTLDQLKTIFCCLTPHYKNKSFNLRNYSGNKIFGLISFLTKSWHTITNNVLFAVIMKHYRTLKYKRNQTPINVEALCHQIHSNSLYLRILKEFRLKFRYT